MDRNYRPAHINATFADMEGNSGIGRYVLLPGSDGRAQEIAKHFSNPVIKTHPRGNHLYLGTLEVEGHHIDVAAIATGMGCPSMEIYLHELYHLGAKRFLRIGTAGSLQPWVKVGNIINVQAAVRDDSTSERYLPPEFPAIASLEVTSAILLAAEHLDLLDDLQTGTVHCKSSLYAREFGVGPLHSENAEYKNLLIQAGVLASEMETATLFIQSQIYNHQHQMEGGTLDQVLAGTILGVVATIEEGYDPEGKVPTISNQTIELGLETIRILAMQELDFSSAE